MINFEDIVPEDLKPGLETIIERNHDFVQSLLKLTMAEASGSADFTERVNDRVLYRFNALLAAVVQNLIWQAASTNLAAYKPEQQPRDERAQRISTACQILCDDFARFLETEIQCVDLDSFAQHRSYTL